MLTDSDQRKENAEPINVSALNHYAYCPRRCGLIYLEGEFADNIHTARGNAEHARADRIAHETTREGARVEYGLHVWNDRLALIGRCDVVEFWRDGTIYPVEYKHGPRRKWLNDDLQLAGQALCLEEMTGKAIARGAIYHATSRRRREVEFTLHLRQQVEEAVTAIRGMLASVVLPPPVNDERCRACSLVELCQPQALAARAAQAAARRHLFDPES